MKEFYQNIKIASKSSGLKIAVLIALLVPSMGAFANGNDGALSDSNFAIILIGMLMIQIALLYVIAGVYKSLAGNAGVLKKLMSSNVKIGVLTGVFALSSLGVFAQGGESSSFVLDSSLETLLISVNAFLLFVIVILLVNVKKIIRALKGTEEVEESVEDDVFSSLGLTDAVSIENENEILLDHDYDGIHELDNNLPPWWLYGFYITIFAAIGYMWYYFDADNRLVGANEYVAELQIAKEEAELRGSSIDENSVKLLTSEADLAAGSDLYNTHCVACHTPTGGGSVGPNLTDEYWIHGGGIKNVFNTIKVGVVEKGMASWESVLSPTDMQKVASFVLSLQGTNPEGGKAPEGDKWTGE